jgi:hypothetical protein
MQIQDRIRAESPQHLKVRCALTDVFVRDIYVTHVFFYKYKLDTSALSHGLARVLGDFAVFNARLHRDGLEHFIECGDTGASFSVRHSSRTLTETIAQLDGNGPARAELIQPIDARGAWSNGAPVLALCVTHFSDNTSALGVSVHHSVGDWSSVGAMLKAWSQTVAGLDYAKPVLVEDRDAYLNSALPPTDQVLPNLRYAKLFELTRLGAYMLTRARDKRRLSMYFDPDELNRMRDALQAECGRRLSTNDAVSAQVWSVISARDVKPRNRRLSIAVDFRRRAQLPFNVLGNMVTTVETNCTWGSPANRVAADLRAEVDQFEDKYLNHRANLQYVQRHGGVAQVTRFIPTAIDPFSGSLLVSNIRGTGIYDIDFGGGPTSHYLSANTAPLPWLGVMHEGFGNQGLIVELDLPSAVAARIRDKAGLMLLHRYRDPQAGKPPAPWLS